MASFTINGRELTQSQSFTLQVALQAFEGDLRVGRLGDDEEGKALAKDYLRNITGIMHLLTLPPPKELLPQ